MSILPLEEDSESRTLDRLEALRQNLLDQAAVHAPPSPDILAPPPPLSYIRLRFAAADHVQFAKNIVKRFTHLRLYIKHLERTNRSLQERLRECEGSKGLFVDPLPSPV